jgi:hypothetical protein
MKRLLFTAMLAIAISAAAQVPTSTTPQSVTNAAVFNGVSTAQASACLANEGQTVHFVFYSAGGATGAPSGVQIRIEASYNSDAATCSTGTWFAVSDDGADPGQNGTNLIFGIGAFPFVRVNLAKCVGCDANDTISASYTGTSSIPGNPFGAYGSGQQIRKMLLVKQAQAGNVNTSTFVTPFGSTAGIISIQSSAVFTGGTLSARCRDLSLTFNVNSFTLPLAGTSFVVPVPATPCNSVDVRCQGCTGTGTYSVSYFLYPPGAAMPSTAQPANTVNAENTAVNATASVSLTPSAIQRGHVFSVSARCSAGTAQLLVVDTTASVNLWTSAATEVGTTTFSPPHWNPGLAGASGDTIQVQLTTCGAANTGTLDVQGSVF